MLEVISLLYMHTMESKIKMLYFGETVYVQKPDSLMSSSKNCYS